MKQGEFSRYPRKSGNRRNQRLHWLMYLPGAVILLYGFWLSLTYS